ncbi:hypothetical protein HMPREF9141_0954 [Prevotella multiformis DSM 16608]|uniref:Uncharacterized protein n=1 Tax=Prevotella multiformis DSM 16608 TaxID=888743 RepID=F0F5T8_9BACT|nr:hypothetical protein HMPREF9141_0954 [Prevotella multiformis DSM 16608]
MFPAAGNRIPNGREQESQHLGTGFPTGWEPSSQTAGNRKAESLLLLKQSLRLFCIAFSYLFTG